MKEELTDYQKGMIDTIVGIIELILAECDEPMKEKVFDKLHLQVSKKKEDKSATYSPN